MSRSNAVIRYDSIFDTCNNTEAEIQISSMNKYFILNFGSHDEN